MHNSVDSLFRDKHPEWLNFLNSNNELASALRDGRYDEAMLQAYARHSNIFAVEAPIAQGVLDATSSDELKKPEGYNN